MGTKQLTQEAEGGASCVSFKRPDTVQAPRPVSQGEFSSHGSSFAGVAPGPATHTQVLDSLRGGWAPWSVCRTQGGYSDLGPGSPRAQIPRALGPVCCSLLNVLSSSGEMFCKR